MEKCLDRPDLKDDPRFTPAANGKANAEELIAVISEEFKKHTQDEMVRRCLLYTSRLKNAATGEKQEIVCDGIFVSVGREPETRMIENQVVLDLSLIHI